MTIKHFPKDGAYHLLFEEVRKLILKMNENLTYAIYHWSRWEWFFARKRFDDDELDQIRLFYEDDRLVGVLMIEDESNIYYYVAENDTFKSLLLISI